MVAHSKMGLDGVSGQERWRDLVAHFLVQRTIGSFGGTILKWCAWSLWREAMGTCGGEHVGGEDGVRRKRE